MASIFDCALMAEDVYGEKSGDLAIRNGWNRTHNARGPSGFFAALYRKGQDYVISYRGTEPATSGDMLTNLEMAPWVGSDRIPEAQSKSAIRFWEYCKQITEGKVRIVTGHSLGGALAKVVSQKKNPLAIAFNAPYIGGLKGAVPMTSMLIHNYNSDQDPVSKTTDRFRIQDGQTTIIPIEPPPAWVTVVRTASKVIPGNSTLSLVGALPRLAAEISRGLHYHSMENLRVAISKRNNLQKAIEIPGS